jgi:hypothetical protein
VGGALEAAGLRQWAKGLVEVALALGRPLAVELGRTLLAPGALLNLGGTPFALLRFLGVPFRGRRMFRRAFALVFCLVMLLGRRHGVGLGFLAVSGDLTAQPLALAFALATPSLDRSSGREQHQRDHDHDGDNNRDYSNRRHVSFVPTRTIPHTSASSPPAYAGVRESLT